MSRRNIKPGDDIGYDQYNFDTSEFICSQHLKDDFIMKFIKENGSKGECNYCKKKINVVELNQVLDLIVTGINYLYEDPANSRYLNKEGIHGFDGNTFDFYDLWHEDYLDLKIEDYSLIEAIFNYLNNYQLYCEINEYGSETEYLADSWLHFKQIVKHEARFVFYFPKIFSNWNLGDPISILDKVQSSILNLNLLTELKDNSILYRCRQHQLKNEIKTEKDLASTPVHLSKKNGRMNPAGISMFYASKSKALTIKEVVDFKNESMPYYTTGIFKTKTNLTLVDLTDLPFEGSIYDSSANKHIDTIRFLRGFIEDVIKPINDNDSIIEYVPTQIVTEYIRFNPQLKVDGILYPSSKDNNLKNIVLFYDHKRSIENLHFSQSSLKTLRI